MKNTGSCVYWVREGRSVPVNKMCPEEHPWVGSDPGNVQKTWPYCTVGCSSSGLLLALVANVWPAVRVMTANRR